ncbi:NAD+ synthase (plasmid) [Halobaculum sp. CBA1158]|uniref:NAD+ synthase n=1 Tax=Halobaculum sp. CBA1158 TaxID=2904243 RepID=UPI001F3ACE7C|nr:NAD+ synthase [Halobaculum sp. CBA1158]UIP01391.1 NAD+ synthase [Halobaculum sp. CBA1158]
MAVGRAREGSREDIDPRWTPEELRDRASALLRSVVDDADASGVVVGLSGGVDSSTTAALAVDALGADAVTGLLLPSDGSVEENLADAREVATDLGIDHATVSLTPAVEVFKRHVAPRIAPRGDEYAAGNFSARLRMACLYFVANVEDRIVVGTSNRTERLLGYFTKHGDGAADVAPLGEYDKTEVRALAEHLGVPSGIVEKSPTAGFWEGQTDEEELGAGYDTLDRALRAIVDRGESPTDADSEPSSAGLDVDPTVVDTQLDRLRASAHKRSRPPTPSRTVRDPGSQPRFATDPEASAAVADAVAGFVRERVAAAGAEGVVVNVSGGLDSSVACAVASEGLGPDRVIGLHLPCHMADDMGTPDPGDLATDLGIDYARVNVRPLVSELEAAMPAELSNRAGTRELGNLVARVRMACAYYVANTTDRLVLGTNNRTERLLGYFTKHGDGGVDIQPLAGMYKTEVRALGRSLGLPDPVIDQEPTAGFEIGRTDEDALGADYDTIDAVLARLVDRDEGIARTASALGVDEATVRRFARLHAETGHKRSRPPTTENDRGDDRYFHELELKFE